MSSCLTVRERTGIEQFRVRVRVRVRVSVKVKVHVTVKVNVNIQVRPSQRHPISHPPLTCRRSIAG